MPAVAPASKSPALPALRAVALIALLSLGAAIVPPAAQAAESVTAAPAASAAAAPADAAYAAALAQFNRALGGDDGAIADSLAQWRALMTADPVNPVYRTYAGAATSMQARATAFPWKKMAYVDDGTALIDKALAQLTPAHDSQRVGGVAASLLVRFTAAGTFNALPAMFNRGDRGARLMDEVLKSPLLAASPLGFQGAVWLRAADDATRAQHADEAKQWLQKLASSGAPQAALAQARLKAM